MLRCGDYKLLQHENADTTEFCNEKGETMNFCIAKKQTLQSFVMKKEDTANFCSPKKRTLKVQEGHYKIVQWILQNGIYI